MKTGEESFPGAPDRFLVAVVVFHAEGEVSFSTRVLIRSDLGLCRA